MTTTTNGTFRTCGEGSFSLTYTCSGPSCTYLNGFPNTTCTTSGSVLSCSNGVTCDATDYTYTSDFTYNQEQSLVTQTQNVQLGICGNFIISSDGTPGGTTSEVTDPGVVSCGSPSNSSTSSSYLMSSSQAPYTNQTTTLPFNTSALTSTSSQSKTTTGPPTTTTPVSFTGAASFQRPPRASIFLVFLLLASLFIQGATAANQPSDIVPARSDPIAPILISDNQNITSIELFRRASTEDPAQLIQDWEDVAKIIGEYVGGKLTKLTEKQQQLFEENFVNEIANAICVHYTGMYANQLITKIIGADLVEACITSALTIAVFDPPAELLAIFAASTMCNAIVGYIFDHTPVLSTITGMVDELCKIPKPCGNPDTLTDPLNCGFCNNTCASSVCINAACTSTGCTGETCSTFTSCGPGSTCVCASTAEGTGYCVDGQTPCLGLSDCATSAQCGSGQICAIESCCNRNVCVGATFCGGGSLGMSPREIFGLVDAVEMRGGTFGGIRD